MNELLLYNMRNAMVFCMLISAITLFPSPFLHVLRSVERLWGRINSWQHIRERLFGGKNVTFCEISMIKFDASEKSRLSKYTN